MNYNKTDKNRDTSFQGASFHIDHSQDSQAQMTFTLTNRQHLHTEMETRTNHTVNRETSTGKCNSMKEDASGNMPYLLSDKKS